jgi:hypothetical protein
LIQRRLMIIRYTHRSSRLEARMKIQWILIKSEIGVRKVGKILQSSDRGTKRSYNIHDGGWNNSNFKKPLNQGDQNSGKSCSGGFNKRPV